MDFYRASENESRYIKYEKNLIHNTALIACEEDNVTAVLEYRINNIEEAEIINFNTFELCNESMILKGLIEEMLFWNPYLKRIIYNKNNNFIIKDTLKHIGFKEYSIWLLDTNSDTNVFRIEIEKIIPDQLTVNKEKVDRVSTWVEKPEDVVVACVEIEDKMVCIDGYSRLVVAHIKGFEYVYAYIMDDSDNMEFYKTCMEWCKDQNVFSIKDLINRIVTPEEHERLWINKCQAYFNECE